MLDLKNVWMYGCAAKAGNFSMIKGNLAEDPGPNYVPCFLNALQQFGVESIKYHLVKKHGFSYNRVCRMRNETAYRVHDWIHGKEGLS